MNDRLKKLAAEFSRHRNIDALLLTTDVNIQYLTDFPAQESWLLVTRERAFYITDFRYIQEAKEGLKGIVSIKQYTQCLPATLFELVKTHKIKKLGFDEKQTSVACLKKLRSYCPRRTKLIPATGLTEGLREIKENREIEAIQEALKVQNNALILLKKVVKPGLTERQVSVFLEGYVKKLGLKFSFSPIIASGPNSAYPHAKVTDRALKNNEPLLIDFGIDVKGYKSDLTRNFFLGRMTPRYRQVFTATALAQKEAISLIRPGVTVAEVDEHARKVLRRFGLAKYFGHSLGHGVGLEIHENPRLSVKSSAILEPGMVVTVEPGVYLPGQFGVRVEDMVLVTKQGCEVLSGNYY
jgi:Xaa-Pro aminopeptidase